VRRFKTFIDWALKIIKEHGGYFVTTFIYSALPLLFLPILTRYLEPAEYANISLFNFYLAISNSLAGTSIPAMVSKNFFDKPKEYIAQIIGNSIFIVFALSLLLFLLLYIFSSVLLPYVDLPLFWFLIIPWCSFFFIIFNITLTVLRNQKKVLSFSYHKIANISINISLSLAFIVLLMWGWEGRLWGVFLSFVISSFIAIYYLWKNEYLNFKISKKIIKKTLNLLLYLLPNSFQAIIISQIGIFFMQLYFTKELLGIYSVGFQVSFAIKLLYMTIGLSWAPYLYEIFSTPKNINKSHLVKLFYFLFFILLSGVIFINIFSETILKIFTTSSYYTAKVYIIWFSLGYLFNGLIVFITPILIKLEKQKQITKISFVNMIIMIVLNIFLSKTFGPIGIAYAFCITYFLMLLSFVRAMQKSFPLPWLSFSIFKPISFKK
jgi:O-antigen/teichoic acid export membrane protein